MFCRALFPCGDAMVCIIDDREDVWNFSPNLIHVKPYRFFQGTADINAPPGLGKTEHDSEPVQHKIVRTISRTNSSDESKTKNLSSKDRTDERKDNKTTKVENQGTGEDSCQREEKEMEVESENGGITESSDGKNGSESKENRVNAPESKENGKEDSSSESKNQEVSENKENVDEDVDTAKDEENERKNEDSATGKKGSSEQSNIQEKDLGNTENVKKDDKELKESEDKAEEEVEEIEWVDEDDYLMYLEDILTKIHSVFYDMYDQSKNKGKETAVKPDLKNIIPYVKRKVLKGVNILFSGVIPTNQPQEKSRAYYVATNLGATVQKEFVPKHKNADSKNATTHVVAAKLGTVKVKTAQKHKYVRLVSADWLWTCAERLERCEERLFPVTSTDSPSVDTQIVKMKKRKNEENEADNKESDVSSKRSRKDNSQGEGAEPGSSTVPQKDSASEGQRQFSTSYNPILAFSDDDIACMDKEVEDLMEEEGEDSEEEDMDRDSRIRSQVLSSGDDENSSSEDSMTGDMPRGWNLKRNRRSKSDDSGSSDQELQEEVRAGDEESENELDKYEKTVAAFSPDSESEGDMDGDSIGSVDDEMAEAVEREFLSQF